MEVSPGVSEKGASEYSMEMVAGMIMSGVDEVVVVLEVARASALISVVICYQEYGK